MGSIFQYLSVFIIVLTCLFFVYSIFSYKRLIPFYKKFITPEFFYLCGKKYINLFILFSIISLSLFAIGFGNGLINHLSKKMNDPFVSFVDVPVEKRFSIQSYYKEIDSDVSKGQELLREKFGLEDDPNYIFQSYENFKNPINNFKKNIKVQQIDLTSRLYKFLIEEKKFLSDYKHVNTESYGVIISADWLKNDPKQKISSISFPQYMFFTKDGENNKEVRFAIPVVGVVERLPEGVGAMVQKDLFQVLQQSWDSFIGLGIDSSYFSNTINCFIVDTLHDSFLDLKSIYNFSKLPENYITNFSPKRLNEQSNKNIELFKNSGYFEINTPDSTQYIKFKKTIENFPDNFFQVHDFQRVLNSDTALAARVQFKFKKDELDKIEDLSIFLRNFTGQEVDMSTVKSKENFDLFNKLAISLSIILAFFSIVSVILYITNLVTSHISRNKKNLGTLKAFGLSNANITFIYSCISLGIVFIAFFISYCLCELIGTFCIRFLTSTAFNIKDTSDIIYQSYPLFTLCGIFIGIPFFFILFKLTKSLKNSTPGDLIYERE